MNFIEAFGVIPSHGWLNEEEARLLWDCAMYSVGPILEVGSYYGRSTALLALTGKKVLAVDSFAGFSNDDPSGDVIHARFMTNMRQLGISNVELYRQRIEDWPPQPVDMAYLDGDHTMDGTFRQIEKAKLCNPRIFCIHDFNDSGGGLEVKIAATSLLGLPDRRVDRIAVWVMNKDGKP